MPKIMDSVVFPQFAGLDLPAQYQSFVVAFCGDLRFNATQAYIDIIAKDKEMDPQNASTAACRLLRDVKVREAVDIEMRRILGDKDKLTQRVIEEHAAIAFAHSDMIHDGITTFGYVVRSINEIPKNYRAAIKGFKKTGDGLLEVQFYDKQKSLDSLARMLGMFDDNARRVGDKYEDMLQAMRARKATKDA